jgi:hypothetical protein
MKAPPPTPLEAGLTTPRQSAEATAASTALPPSRSASRPILEHRQSSAATAPCGDVTTSLRPAAPGAAEAAAAAAPPAAASRRKRTRAAVTRSGSGSHWRRRGRAAELRKDGGSLAKRMDSVLITPSEGKTQDFLTSHGAGERESREPLDSEAWFLLPIFLHRYRKCYKSCDWIGSTSYGFISYYIHSIANCKAFDVAAHRAEPNNT